ncbi:MAG: hypothetical protein K0V04_01660 [Deltaproteobacteria bacterium]|nr:hypothetical protein [Deltaproteobacteria bacterium]
MRQRLLLLTLLTSCTGSPLALDMNLDEEESMVERTTRRYQRPPPPTTVSPHLAGSHLTWVWVEGPNALGSCIGGCTGPWKAPADDIARRWRQPLAIEAAGPEGLPTISRHTDEGDTIWKRELSGMPGAGASRTPRVIACGYRTFAVVESTRLPWYRFYAFESASGAIQARADISHGDERVQMHQVQLACSDADQALVFGRTRNDDRGSTYVDQLTWPGAVVFTSTRPAARTDAEPQPVVGRPPLVATSSAQMHYRVIGGEASPWSIGVDDDGQPAGKPRSLVVEAASRGRRWSVDLGPAVRSNVQIIEVDAMTIVRVGDGLYGIDRIDGRLAWTSRLGGARHELYERYGDGIWGCSRCREPEFHMRVEDDMVVVSETSVERWVNVVRPQDGTVLARRIWY